jgi:phosphoribosyl 1,2-cyclic phosphate phosphodiesterase
MRVTILGSGTSHGVPIIGCECKVCRSEDPRDKRSRASILVEEAGARFLVDCGPEFRLQALQAGIRALDAVLLTHAHADHVHGLDDLRVFTGKRAMRIYGNQACLDELRERFAYVFTGTQEGGGKPKFALTPLDNAETVIEGIKVRAIPVFHGSLRVNAYRFGPFAYLTDLNRIPETSLASLEGIESLLIDGLRFAPHPTHFSIDQAAALASKLGVKRCWITHLTHEHGHLELLRALRAKKIEPAWDGLVFEA